jgi:hypothetical protein
VDWIVPMSEATAHAYGEPERKRIMDANPSSCTTCSSNALPLNRADRLPTFQVLQPDDHVQVRAATTATSPWSST